MASCDRAEDVVDGLLGGDRAVVDDEVALQSVGDVVPPSSRMVHRSEVLDKDYKIAIQTSIIQIKGYTERSTRVVKSPGFSKL